MLWTMRYLTVAAAVFDIFASRASFEIHVIRFGFAAVGASADCIVRRGRQHEHGQFEAIRYRVKKMKIKIFKIKTSRPLSTAQQATQTVLKNAVSESWPNSSMSLRISPPLRNQI